MESESLLDLAKAIRDASARVSQLTIEHVPEWEPLVDREVSLVEDLVAKLEAREQNVALLTATLADRLNNLLMAVQTVSDLLRTPPDEAATVRLRRHLDATVGAGKASLTTLVDAVGQLR